MFEILKQIDPGARRTFSESSEEIRDLCLVSDPFWAILVSNVDHFRARFGPFLSPLLAIFELGFSSFPVRIWTILGSDLDRFQASFELGFGPFSGQFLIISGPGLGHFGSGFWSLSDPVLVASWIILDPQ